MLKGKFIPRSVVLSVLVFLVLAIYGWSTSDAKRTRALADSECPTVALAWQSSIAQTKQFGFSDVNNLFFTIGNEGMASVYSASGEKRCIVDIDHANRLSVAPSGEYVMAYSHLNPVDSTLTFFDSHGKKYWNMNVDGAIWSVGACTDKDRTRFVVGTGDKYVYVIDISAKSRKYHRWRAPGVVVSLNVDPKGGYVTLGTWQDSSVTRCTLTGKRLWSADADPKELQYVEQIHSPDRSIVRSIPNKAGVDGRFVVIDDHGKEMWRGSIKSAENTQVLYSPNGRYVCLGYEKMISHKGQTTLERHAALFNANGERLWDKGSLFFHPRPLAVTSGGCVVISNEKNAIFAVSRSGELDSSIKLPSGVVRSVVSPDGSRVLTECSNGKLYMLRISR